MLEQTKKMTNSNQKTSYLKGWLICGLGAIFFGYEYFLRITPSVMTAELSQTFEITAAKLGYLSAFYYYAYTPMQAPVGILMDRFGPRKLLTMACLTCVIGAYLFAFTDTFWVAKIARALIGFGSAFAFVGVLALATIWLLPNYFSRVAGLATTLGMGGGMVGDFILAKLVEYIGWRETLRYSADVGVALTIIIWFFIRDSIDGKKITKTKYMASWGKLFKNFLQVIVNRQIWLAGVVGSILYLSLTAFAELWGVPYLEAAYGYTRQEAASAISMVFLGWAIGAPIAGLLSDRLSRRVLPLTIGSFVAAICVAIVLYVPDLLNSAVFTILFLYGGFCSAEVTTFALSRENSRTEISATAIAVTNMLIMSSGMIFQPMVGHLLDFFWDGEFFNQTRIYSPLAYQKALSILPILLIISAGLTYFIKETYCKVKS